MVPKGLSYMLLHVYIYIYVYIPDRGWSGTLNPTEFFHYIPQYIPNSPMIVSRNWIHHWWKRVKKGETWWSRIYPLGKQT